MKGFITLEYVLLIASIVSIIATLVFGIINLYNRNISAIDDTRFTDFCKELKAKIELFEIMPEGKDEIEANNLLPWNIKKNGGDMKLEKTNKSCEIKTNLLVSLQINNITKNQKINLIKQNNTLNIN